MTLDSFRTGGLEVRSEMCSRPMDDECSFVLAPSTSLARRVRRFRRAFRAGANCVLNGAPGLLRVDTDSSNFEQNLSPGEEVALFDSKPFIGASIDIEDDLESILRFTTAIRNQRLEKDDDMGIQLTTVERDKHANVLMQSAENTCIANDGLCAKYRNRESSSLSEDLKCSLLSEEECDCEDSLLSSKSSLPGLPFLTFEDGLQLLVVCQCYLRLLENLSIDEFRKIPD